MSEPLGSAKMPFPGDHEEPEHSPTAGSSAHSAELTRLLIRWGEGDAAAVEAITPIVYDELRRLARAYMRRERSEHTLQSTAVVHEAYIRLLDQQVSWSCRSHFFAIAAQMMRRILVDHARAQSAAKRGDGAVKVSLEDHVELPESKDKDLLALDLALQELAKVDPQRAKLVELKFFGGLSKEEIADVMQISPATVQRHWASAKAWLFHEMRTSL